MIRLETKRKKCVNIVGVGSLPPSIKFDAQCGRLGLRVSFVFIGGAAGRRGGGSGGAVLNSYQPFGSWPFASWTVLTWATRSLLARLIDTLQLVCWSSSFHTVYLSSVKDVLTTLRFNSAVTNYLLVMINCN